MEAAEVNDNLKKHVPAGISEILNQQYKAGDKDAMLDIYFPSSIANTQKLLPVIVWIHGGGWISGNKGLIANYCKILAAQGYAVVSIDYSIAPEKSYPVPVRQANAALGWLKQNANRFHINPAHFVLAGDSGGAHIASQTANIITDSSYAKLLDISPSLHHTQLSGLLLYCGTYDTQNIDRGGSSGDFLKTVLWAYSGKKHFMKDEFFKTASVINYVTGNFPPSFISAGNGDLLCLQSQAFARKLCALNVKVDTLFFPSGHKPSLELEYQFNLDNDAGKKALQSSVEFLSALNLNDSTVSK